MCTVIKWSANGVAQIAARNMDWIEDMKSNLWLFPRGIKREGLAKQNSLEWTSNYGSLVTSAYDIGTTDGMNERSLAGHMLWLAESDYGERDESIPGLSISLWLQFFLDNFATVSEAVNYVQDQPFQLLPGMVANTGQKSEVHLMIEDVSGDAAIFEYVGGKPKIYHGKQYSVMTNDPTFEKQLKHMKQYEGFGGDKSLPGTTQSADRFVRASYYQKSLPRPTSTREAIAEILSVARNVSQPFGIPDPYRPHISAIRWRTVCDLTNRVYYFESTTSPNIIWVRLDELDFSDGAPVKKLDLVGEPDRVGDVSSQFKATNPMKFMVP
jgi:penicillin V acylase-like amidase (Ntn superfamily)